MATVQHRVIETSSGNVADIEERLNQAVAEGFAYAFSTGGIIVMTMTVEAAG
jgi:hypothetical protein